MAGIYVHVPFCAGRCIYCDFYSTVERRWIDDYIAAVGREAMLRRNELAGNEIATVYMGGGTPSLLTAVQMYHLMEQLSRAFDLSRVQEFTVEVNPDDVSVQYVCELARLGVNRVSMGVQSLVDDELRFINRRHTASQAQAAVGSIREAGIHNVSIDLIYGIPGQTVTTWRRSVEEALSLQVQHISAYNLSYERGTRLWQMRERGELAEVDDDACVEMYRVLCQMLGQANFEHYEISNFCMPGYRSRHNSSYWDDTTYLGLGAAAHSYDGRVRRFNPADLRRYLRAIEKGIPAYEAESLQWWERYDEMVMVRLRTARGLNGTVVRERFGDSAYRHLEAAARRQVALGMLRTDGENYVLTADGVMMSDAVIRDLMWG